MKQINKRGQSISINTIIIAAIALAVLVVLFMIFTGRIGIFSKGVGDTTNCDQACKSAGYSKAGTSKTEDSNGQFPNCDTTDVEIPGALTIQNGKRIKCCCMQNPP